MIYVDANYWIYWLDQRLPEHQHVLKPMRDAVNEGIILNTITLMEVAHHLRHLPEDEFQTKLDTIQNLATLRLVSLDPNLVRNATTLLAKHAETGIGGRDSVILATMENTDTKRIATHDRVFTKIKNLEIIDPIPKRDEAENRNNTP